LEYEFSRQTVQSTTSRYNIDLNFIFCISKNALNTTNFGGSSTLHVKILPIAPSNLTQNLWGIEEIAHFRDIARFGPQTRKLSRSTIYGILADNEIEKSAVF